VTISVKAKPTITGVTVNGKPVASGAQLKAGDTVTLSGTGFQPNETVSVILQSTPVTLKTVAASATGNVTVTVTLPTNLAAGAHSLTLRGALASVVFPFTVAAAAPSATPGASPTATGAGGTRTSSGGGSLPSTGSPVLPGFTAAFLLILLGSATMIFAGSRRRRSH
jgi:pSer/pThr/pTyr-binding forkhead associated (FHA) protein